jgi:hypothetical protein
MANRRNKSEVKQDRTGRRHDNTGKFVPKQGPIANGSHPAPTKRSGGPQESFPGHDLPENMARELKACAKGAPSDDRVGAALRMHLKMRGLLKDAAAGKLTPQGWKLAKVVPEFSAEGTTSKFDHRTARAKWDEALQKMRDSTTGQFVAAK